MLGTPTFLLGFDESGTVHVRVVVKRIGDERRPRPMLFGRLPVTWERASLSQCSVVAARSVRHHSSVRRRPSSNGRTGS